MSSALDYRQYDTAGSKEIALMCGAENASIRILIIPPLFEEMNRMRRVLTTTIRHLSKVSCASYLIDLPGCNESFTPLPGQDLKSWHLAVADSAKTFMPTHIVSIRGGALIDHALPELPHWRLAPTKGASLAKTMLRTRVAADKEAGKISTVDGLIAASGLQPLELAGNLISGQMLAQLLTAEPNPLPNCENVTLGNETDQISGSALWLRTEPGDDPEMAINLSKALAEWCRA